MFESEFKNGADLFAARRYHEAIQVYVAIVLDTRVQKESKLRALNNLSGCLACVKNYTEALEMAKQALQLESDNTRALTRAATACEGLEQYDEAIGYLERAQRLEPTSTGYAATLAKLREQARRRRAAPSETSKEDFYYNKSLQKGKEAMKNNEFAEAARQFTKALSLAPENCTAKERAVLLCNRSAAYFRAGDSEQSAADAQVAITVDATYARAYHRLAVAKHKMKQYESSYELLQKCLKVDPAHAEAKLLLVEVKPLVDEMRKTAAQRQADEVRHVAEVREEQINAQTTATAAPVRGPAHASSFVYCNYCNESGHTRAECRMRFKRPRPT